MIAGRRPIRNRTGDEFIRSQEEVRKEKQAIPPRWPKPFSDHPLRLLLTGSSLIKIANDNQFKIRSTPIICPQCNASTKFDVEVKCHAASRHPPKRKVCLNSCSWKSQLNDINFELNWFQKSDIQRMRILIDCAVILDEKWFEDANGKCFRWNFICLIGLWLFCILKIELRLDFCVGDRPFGTAAGGTAAPGGWNARKVGGVQWWGEVDVPATDDRQLECCHGCRKCLQGNGEGELFGGED